MTQNGKILLEIIDRHELIVGNCLDICQGVITRQRTVEERVE